MEIIKTGFKLFIHDLKILYSDLYDTAICIITGTTLSLTLTILSYYIFIFMKIIMVMMMMVLKDRNVYNKILFYINIRNFFS